MSEDPNEKPPPDDDKPSEDKPESKPAADKKPVGQIEKMRESIARHNAGEAPKARHDDDDDAA
jgi:hypothetical protein